MKAGFMVLAALGLLCLQSNAQHKSAQKPKEKIEALVLAKVKQVPEVKQFFRTAAGQRPDLMMDRRPDGDFMYYEVKMGLTGGDIFRTAERFCVDPRTMKVYYWDVMADDMAFSSSAIITLEQWRKLRKTAAWQKPHTYKAGKLVALTK
ncbi:hypothetical protein BEL04_10265 [Mucilaginibacter sp. PPCGB 2223]|uniref:hypothetical protein n=1 Tax=Mucilaginibacter sp. PPCGB 2223 TaxID=1886027 RepID=UPI0008257F93|nr:hypothetical protein [Mucilaginibacter sp. PPCGB 2223]OCX54606.1 hypothetical protein BEL04_10265 [Mucilaginibacter sp. PPCGB 2223]